MSERTFSAAYRAGAHLVYDPRTELTHHTPHSLNPGRTRREEDEVASWPTIGQRQVPTDMPLNICWSPLVRCNLSCPQCLDDKTLTEAGAAERLRIAGVLAASGALGLDISGGEPLLLRDLPQLLGVLASEGAAVSCTTNGWHLQRRAPELAPVLDAVRVSFDGPDAPSHDRWRGAGSFVRACAGVQAAVAAGLPVQLHVVVMHSTLHRLQEVAELAASVGAGGVTFLQMLPIGEGAELAGAEAVDDAEAARAVAALSPPEGVRLRLRSRNLAEGFTVVRADGRIYRNGTGAQHIRRLQQLHSAADLRLPAPEGSRS